MSSVTSRHEAPRPIPSQSTPMPLRYWALVWLICLGVGVLSFHTLAVWSGGVW